MTKTKKLSFPYKSDPLLLYPPSLKITVDYKSLGSPRIKLIIEGKNFSEPDTLRRLNNFPYKANIVITVESQNGKYLNDFPKREKIKSDGTFGKLETYIEGAQILKIYATDEFTNRNTRIYKIEIGKNIIISDDLPVPRSYGQSIGGG